MGANTETSRSSARARAATTMSIRLRLGNDLMLCYNSSNYSYEKVDSILQ